MNTESGRCHSSCCELCGCRRSCCSRYNFFPLFFSDFCHCFQLEETDAAAGSKRRRTSVTIPL
jgi:hypothetical protein